MSDDIMDRRINARLPDPTALSPEELLRSVIEAKDAEITRLHAEAAELRAQLTAGPDKVLRCAFCGFAYPDGTPTHKHDSLAAHVRVCTEHPVGKELRDLRADLASAKAEVESVRAALHGLVGLLDAHRWGDGPALRAARAAPAPTPSAQQQEKHTTHPEGGSREP